MINIDLILIYIEENKLLAQPLIDMKHHTKIIKSFTYKTRVTRNITFLL